MPPRKGLLSQIQDMEKQLDKMFDSGLDMDDDDVQRLIEQEMTNQIIQFPEAPTGPVIHLAQSVIARTKPAFEGTSAEPVLQEMQNLTMRAARINYDLSDEEEQRFLDDLDALAEVDEQVEAYWNEQDEFQREAYDPTYDDSDFDNDLDMLDEIDRYMRDREALQPKISAVANESKKAGSILTFISGVLNHIGNMLKSFMQPKQDAKETLGQAKQVVEQSQLFKTSLQALREKFVAKEKGRVEDFKQEHGGRSPTPFGSRDE